MLKEFTLEYWKDESWWVGRLREVPGVFSQGRTLDELEENIKDAFEMMREDLDPTIAEVHTRQLEISI